jgi:hypothetical protein
MDKSSSFILIQPLPQAGSHSSFPSQVNSNFLHLHNQQVFHLSILITFIVGTLFHIPDSPDPGNMNQQGWLSPCRPDGQWWQGQLYIVTPLNSQINRKAPATPHTTRPGEVRSGGAPGQSEDEGGERKVDEGMGAGIEI